MLKDLEARAAASVEGKVILITGAAGTIGRALARRLAGFKPGVVRLLDHNEEQAFYLDMEFGKDDRFRILLGDIRDRERMKRALQGVQVVFHSAALKHVGLSEYNPFEVVQTNLVALQYLLELSIDAGVERFVFTSSDKAVNPTNVLGGSKFIGERLVSAANMYRGYSQGVFASTRFGNVLGSAGSVVPVFKRQIQAGGPVTVTDSRMTRFFMTEGEAVDLLLAALVQMRGGEVFVPKMHAACLGDLASCMVELCGAGRPVRTVEIGLRPGEKMYEELISEQELPRCLETEKLLILLPFAEEAQFQANGRMAAELGPDSYPGPCDWAKEVFASRTATPISRGALRDLLGPVLQADDALWLKRHVGDPSL